MCVQTLVAEWQSRVGPGVWVRVRVGPEVGGRVRVGAGVRVVAKVCLGYGCSRGLSIVIL